MTAKAVQATQEVERCLWCGRKTDSKAYIINPKARHELPCCGEECFGHMQKFVERDKRYRMMSYLILGALVVANLFFFGLMPDTRWKYLPMLGIGVFATIFPYVFASYERYQRFGARRTTMVVRVFTALFAVFSLLLIALY